MKASEIKVGEEYAVAQYAGRDARREAVQATVVEVQATRTTSDHSDHWHPRTVVKHDGIRIRLASKPLGFGTTWDAGQEHVVTGRNVLCPWPEMEAERAAEAKRHAEGQAAADATITQWLATAERFDALGVGSARRVPFGGFMLTGEQMTALLDLIDTK